MKSSKIIVIDDEPDILELLKYNFEKEKAEVKTFVSPGQAWAYMKDIIPDLVVCDWMMDDMEGVDLCRQLKKDPDLMHVPFVMLTAKDHETDVVTALELGAEEYLVKPVRIKELIVRLKIILRRQREQGFQQEKSFDMNKVLRYKELTLDPEKHKVFVRNMPLELTFSEFKILQLLITRSGNVYSRKQIIEKLNGFDYVATERSVDVQILGLRRKLGPVSNYLETVRGVGYRLKDLS